ncbi:MAG: hypothetical protein H6528_08620 [Actinobacteria bacterium]|nr:hypothetical protein [Actinomycetota bacterium]MCB8997347.1 hypothetical protein [Actinomycetota bacterium]MCB9423654.1 hypothetical protein [Actinomycetota bacterium]HRY10715.1 glycerophosphodiester phosphodiesterase family protein [Candidatus Nanopelagicales bacterium]
MVRRRTTAGVAVLAALAAGTTVTYGLEGRPASGMLVIAHRGASAYTTESSAAAYEMASNVGADLLEGDLVMSRDGVLVVCHDIDLSRVTDVAGKFPWRKQPRVFNGVTYEGWWVDEFTWAELSTLTKPNGQGLLRLDDLIWLAQSRAESLYIEIKESEYFAAPQPNRPNALDITGTLINTLLAKGLAGRGSSFWVQSDNPNDLVRVKQWAGNRTVFLTRSVSPDDVGYFPGFRQFADVLGVPTTRARRGLVQQAHAADLGVHVWTLQGSRDAYRKAAAIGADGVITDFPDLGVDVRSRQRGGDRPSGLTSRVENGSAIATWTASPGSWYAVTFDFGDPLLAPTQWVQGGSASIPMADAKNVDITVARFDGARMGGDAFTRASIVPISYDEPRTKTRVRNVSAVVSSDAKTRITGVMERQKGAKWVPLRNGAGWLRGRGEDVSDLRRKFRSDKKGEFSLTVKVRKDILDGYVPERSWMVGVTATKKLKPSSSEWIDTKEGPPPAPKRPGRSQSLPAKDVKVRVR